MKVLITGAAGFIGHNLAKRLLGAGDEVCGIDAFTDYYDVSLKEARAAELLDHPHYTEHRILIEDSAALSEVFSAFAPDYVVHLAAQAGVRYSIENPRAYVDTNVVGSFNIIDLCKIHRVKHLVLASTSSAYGANTAYPYHETDKAAHPLTIYAATKLASEMIAHSHSHLFDIPTTVLRFFTVYGPWGRPDMAPMKFAKRIFSGEPIDVYNYGKMERDFTYIDDLTKGIALLLPKSPKRGQRVSEADSLSPAAPYRLVNIGNAQPQPLMDFITALETSSKKQAQMNMMEMQPGDVMKTAASSALLFDLTGFRPATPMTQGVSQFIEWYKAYYGV